MHESQLLRTCGASVTAARLRNPGCRPAYEGGLDCLIAMNSFMQVWLIHGCHLQDFPCRFVTIFFTDRTNIFHNFRLYCFL